jgi:CRISPR-associated protein Cas5t
MSSANALSTIWLRVRAPFAAFRPLAAGVFRGTTRTIAHSAAYGLVLNFAAVESRGDGARPVTAKRAGLPVLDVAIGDSAPNGQPAAAREVAVLYQQLHGYPVGNSSANLAEKTHGAKYHIAPARRELLVGLDVVIGARAFDDEGARVLERVAKGVAGELDGERYGLPFVGDNNLLIDRVDVTSAPSSACWYTPVRPGDSAREGTVRLTSVIDRDDSARTVAGLFAPLERATTEVPAEAWVRAS